MPCLRNPTLTSYFPSKSIYAPYFSFCLNYVACPLMVNLEIKNFENPISELIFERLPSNQTLQNTNLFDFPSRLPDFSKAQVYCGYFTTCKIRLHVFIALATNSTTKPEA